jgi:two-component system nitrate/nitrite response regulator NarL
VKRGQIRVVVADDHPVYREGIAHILRERPEFELAGEARDGDEALAAILASKPDVALLDVRLPRRDGIQVLKKLRANGHAGTRVLMLSASDDGASVYESIAAGASGYMLKDAERGAICDALVAVAEGQSVLSLDLQAHLIEMIRQHEEANVSALSPRETEVLRLTASGHSAREVAAELIVSPATIRTHLQHIYEKLAVSDRASAVAEGMRRGYLD